MTALAEPASSDDSSIAPSLQWLGGLDDGRLRAVGLNLRLFKEPLWRSTYAQVEWYPELQAQYWWTRTEDGHRTQTAVGGGVLFARLSTSVCSRCFFDIGLGGFAIENRSALDSRPSGSNFTFSEQIGLGLYLDAARRGELRVGFAHFSNGSLARPNPGYDFIQIHARMSF